MSVTLGYEPCSLLLNSTYFNVLRRFKEAELQSALQLQQRRTHRPLSSSLEKLISCAQATPSLPRTSNILPQSVPLISSSCLMLSEGDTEIGKGWFGTCSKMIYKDMYTVCVKAFAESLLLNFIRAEANIHCLLNCGEHTPHCFGICLAKRAIVSSYVSMCNTQDSSYVFIRLCTKQHFSRPSIKFLITDR